MHVEVTVKQTDYHASRAGKYTDFNLYCDLICDFPGVYCECRAPHLLQGPAGVGAHAVQLVDEGEEGDVVAFHLPVHRHGLTLDPSHRTQDQHGAVQHAQRSLHFDGKVHVTWRDDSDV